eukprot:TRINITY_DN2624_c1_g1_i2.p1 TRINITY_DN2624_c1_g1~~TRINITY_DN2624_c1_g1_i2.p1  ORF type:complete len:408 (+),score=91.73 TRINITY_DN2624_c1_g1_i2:59-1282(+)
MTAKRGLEEGTPVAKRQHHGSEAARLAMQLTVTFADSEYPDVVFSATEESTVKDAAEAAADEWGTDAGFLELSLGGDVLPSTSRLVGQCGVVADSVLDASLLRWIGKELLMNALQNDNKKRILLALIGRSGHHHHRTLCLDTPTFVDGNGLLAFNADWIPRSDEEEENGEKTAAPDICFGNPDPDVVSVASNFLEDVRNLKISNVDLMGLQHVTSLDGRFLKGCSTLTSLDLSALSGVTSIGNEFLAWCDSLTTIDLSGIQHVTSIGDDFLFACRSLTSVHHQLQELKCVGNGFFYWCESLTVVDLSTFQSIESIGEGFLAKCLSLESVDLSSFGKVTEIKDGFLFACGSLKKITNMSGLRNVVSVGYGILNECGSLNFVDLDGESECLNEVLKKLRISCSQPMLVD